MDTTEEANVPESALVPLAVVGDLEAFNELVLLHQDRVFRQALWILNDDTAAEDATQEALIKIVTRLSSFAGHAALRRRDATRPQEHLRATPGT